ncbi:MAG TPA: hypothetical protein PL017_08615 [Tenuifilaceae bacterium]|nr:hypothetical protein [Tenuifilaceae bacterium]HPE18993.1 hypothetical protein [Tenuifilaceae bacterium]HPJ46146.1 hypothetical protein [Tenuifilaceae bacterium]HPQ34700.1 hypothetical protein [Tenuifilaceae bacterium]HRX68128.1 hypothetical protein [Tenuifilaceae bacterium]
MKRIWLVIIVVAALSSCEKKISEFQSSNFIKFFGSGSLSNGFDVKELPNGYLAVGFDNTSDLDNQFLVVRTDKAGNTIWQKSYGTDFADEAYTVHVDGDNYYVGGTTTDDDGIVSSHILHLNSQGDSLGCLAISGENYSLKLNNFCVSESSIVVVGETNENSAIQSDYFISKYSFEGAPQWQKDGVYGAEGSSQSFKKVFVDGDRIVAVGTNNGWIGSTLTHISITPFNLTTGAPLFFFNMETTVSQQFGDAILLGEGDIVIAYNQLVQGKYEARLIRISLSDYSTVWHVESGIPCQAKSLTLATDGTIILSGERDELIYIFKFDDSGNITLSSPSEETDVLLGSVEAVVSTSDNGLVIVGTTAPDYGTMMQLIKTDSELYLFKP